jgi:hypothetical protein
MEAHPNQLMALTTIHLDELAAEAAHDRLAKAVAQAQQPERQPRILEIIYAITGQFLQKWPRPAWQAVFKHG